MRQHILLLAMSWGLALPCVADGPSSQPSSRPTSPLPSAPAYNPIVERGMFLRIVGVDNELDAKEFAAHRGKPNSFVRSDDSWERLLAFDKNGNQTIDWFEADAYRRTHRVGPPVAEGGTGGSPRRRSPSPGGASSQPAGRFAARARRVGPTSRPAGVPGVGARPQVSADARQRQASERMEQALRRRFDRDGDGELNEKEQAEFEQVRDRMREQMRLRREQMMKRLDTNGDGEVSEEERRAAFRRGANRGGRQRRRPGGNGGPGAGEQ
jgi:EF hand domain-containing protein